jgi:hypothetical protein
MQGSQAVKQESNQVYNTDYTEKNIRPQITRRSNILRFARLQPVQRFQETAPIGPTTAWDLLLAVVAFHLAVAAETRSKSLPPTTEMATSYHPIASVAHGSQHLTVCLATS